MRETRKQNVRVEITPYSGIFRDLSIDEQLKEAHRLATEAKRHLDDFGSVRVEFDVEAYCSHCGYLWTEGPNAKHNGGCCKEDVAVMDAELAAQAAERPEGA